MPESFFQQEVIADILKMYPNAVILKQDPNYLQGIPDWLILHGPKWAALETKDSARSIIQPNQLYYVNLLNTMSYASFIFPENRRRVLSEIQRYLSKRNSRQKHIPRE